LNDPFELPSLEGIQQIDRQRLQAIEALEICDHSVKCQRCGIAVPIVGKLTRPCNDRSVILQRRIKWMENYCHGANVNDLKALKQPHPAVEQKETVVRNKSGMLLLLIIRSNHI
jgi:hypothetical protein